MSKHALIASIATRTSESQATVGRVLDALGAEAAAILGTPGEEVILPGLGKLKSVHKAARTGRNPSNGAAVQIAAKTVTKFVAGKALKEAIN